ncbi:LCP family protein [Zhihengliuella halotolerans]|uniref:LytR family transcriptional attenuator n=1 Tax=Zhihengliuella halotolerans TaxID=370736 RepID=A0A4Q8ABM9_9MICC|nr:LCP family protein [Zhihengliuella halotolerans]RZU61572.1 LytR family transcriptional attenuator [Zhihengliuella halotolerans]
MAGVDGMGDGYTDEPRPRKKRTGVVALIAVLLVVLIAAGVAVGYLFSLKNSFDQKSQSIESAFPTSDRPDRSAESADAINYLVIGSDSRGGSGETEDLPRVPNGGRADTMMLVNIPGDRESINVMSIMRDTWVEIPGRGEHKINAALAFGGVPLLVETIESVVDVPIDHVAIIDFEGFKALTESLGGVEVNNPRAFTVHGGGQSYTYESGPITLEGDKALRFVRERKQFADGDYTRVANQQLFLKAVMAQFLTRETLTDPGKISNIVDDFSPFVSVDDEVDAFGLGKLGVSLRNVRSSDVHTFTLPNQGTGRSADGQSIVIHDPATTQAISEAMQKDTLTSYIENHGLEN